MKKKMVVLCSGGFDSAVLLYRLKDEFPERDIIPLHFMYGALNEDMQRRAVDRLCKKLRLPVLYKELPRFTWTHSNFYKKGKYDLKKQYLEYRNLIFLSYALSYAQAVGACEIYSAIFCMDYVDTSADFMYHISKIAEMGGIQIVFPFANLNKQKLISDAINYGIEKEDYFSCDKPDPNTKEPCGKCADCQELAEVESEIYNPSLLSTFVKNGMSVTDIDFLRRADSTKDIKTLEITGFPNDLTNVIHKITDNFETLLIRSTVANSMYLKSVAMFLLNNIVWVKSHFKEVCINLGNVGFPKSFEILKDLNLTVIIPYGRDDFTQIVTKCALGGCKVIVEAKVMPSYRISDRSGIYDNVSLIEEECRGMIDGYVFELYDTDNGISNTVYQNSCDNVYKNLLGLSETFNKQEFLLKIDRSSTSKLLSIRPGALSLKIQETLCYMDDHVTDNFRIEPTFYNLGNYDTLILNSDGDVYSGHKVEEPIGNLFTSNWDYLSSFSPELLE